MRVVVGSSLVVCCLLLVHRRLRHALILLAHALRTQRHAAHALRRQRHALRLEEAREHPAVTLRRPRGSRRVDEPLEVQRRVDLAHRAAEARELTHARHQPRLLPARSFGRRAKASGRTINALDGWRNNRRARNRLLARGLGGAFRGRRWRRTPPRRRRRQQLVDVLDAADGIDEQARAPRGRVHAGGRCRLPLQEGVAPEVSGHHVVGVDPLL
jgi:hypothetical protein